MARSTYQTYLLSGTAADSLTKIADIKEFPDMGDSPDGLDTTTLSDGFHHYIPDIKDTGMLEFTLNYDKTTFTTIKGYEGTKRYWALCFGDETGTDGKVTFEGYPTIVINGGGVSDVVEMTLGIAVDSDLAFS